MTDSVVNHGGSPSSTSMSLLVQVKAGNQEAWNRFVALYGPLVFRWCCHSGLQHADAADIGQDVFRTVSVSIVGYERRQGEGTFRGWLWTVTRSRILDFRRRQERAAPGVGGSDFQRRLSEIPSPTLESEDPTDEDDELQLLRRAVELVLGDCKRETREAFLRVIGGAQPKDVARELDMSLNAVYLAKSHILQRVREALAGMVEL